jgi:sulfonate transport system substrate-binding protein
MEDLRVFADEFRDGVQGYSTNEFIVRADGPKTAKDLKGKTLATNAIGSMVDIAMRGWLRKAGLEDKRDYNVIETGLNTMKAVLKEKKVELVAAVPPFMFDPELKAIGRTMFTQRDAMGPSELGVWAAKDSFLKKNRAAVIDLLEDTMTAQRWFNDPANHDEAVKIVADVTKAPAALFSDWMFTRKDYYRDPKLVPDVKAMQANIDLQGQLGFLKGKMDVKKFVDLSYVTEAGKRPQ